ncbi:MAG TPA: FecR family protein [Candidatus Solibacter sp.]|nr:FecR family protein [Candidatus Solibacter sp.]
MSRRAISLLAIFCAVVCLNLLPAARAGEVSHARIVRLSYTLGDVQISANGASGWQKAIANTPLREGISVATGDGRAEVEFENGAMTWLASNTVLEIPQLALEDGAKNTQIRVKQGTATFYVDAGRHDSFTVEAGKLTIGATGSSRFRVDVFEDGAGVSVLRGAPQVAVNGTAQRVSGHQTLAVRNDAAGAPVVNPNPRADAWDHWVGDRYDAVATARITTTDNLNTPYGYGAADLSMYGGWVSLPGYGVGWQPFGVGAGWSPFFNGYWDGFGAFGPTWISYEPWGWLPYHYGGWVFSPVYGWVWAASGFGAYRPATVAWVRTAGGIGWVAQTPHEPAGGTPANLARGLVTNTPAGMVNGTRNTIVRGVDAGKVQTIGEWKSDAELGRITQQAQGSARTAVTGPAKGAGGAPRMPEGGAARIATAGMYGGHVHRYEPPSPPRHSGGSGGAAVGTFGGSTTTAAVGPSASSGAHGGAAPSHAASGGGGGSRGKP